MEKWVKVSDQKLKKGTEPSNEKDVGSWNTKQSIWKSQENVTIRITKVYYLAKLISNLIYQSAGQT